MHQQAWWRSERLVISHNHAQYSLRPGRCMMVTCELRNNSEGRPHACDEACGDQNNVEPHLCASRCGGCENTRAHAAVGMRRCNTLNSHELSEDARGAISNARHSRGTAMAVGESFSRGAHLGHPSARASLTHSHHA
eukprot:scaffold229065_cov33-Tisochrysis_lutea.AAC.2